MKRVAVVGAGIAGMAAAHELAATHQVTLYEAGPYFGGHTNTVDVTLDGVTHGVDTGFLVFNQRTYPQLIALFQRLGVATAKSEMSFSVQIPAQPGQVNRSNQPALEWSGNSLNSVFTQRSNLLRPRFLGMLQDLLRFNKQCTALALRNQDAELRESIQDFLARHRFGQAFSEAYFLPMMGCIWSCPTDQMLRFPVATMIRFCHNHGLLQITNRPQWFTVAGGAKHYVGKLLHNVADKRLNTPVRRVRRAPGVGVAVVTDQGSEFFDDVVLACHSDQALALLENAKPEERAVLGAVRYRANHAVLHTDAAVLPSKTRAWAAWNYARATHASREQAAVCLHYLINKLQPLPWRQPVIVSLNPDPQRPIAAASVLGRYDYSHPVFDAAAVQAQALLPQVQGRDHVWFCGAWTRYGFHEDGLMSAQSVVDALRQRHGLAATPLQRAA